MTITTASNTIATTVASIGSLVVGPKETAANPSADGYPNGSAVVRTFVITNASNVTDAYTLTSVTSAAGRIASIFFIDPAGNASAAQPQSTVSPQVPPGGSLKVSITVATAGIPIGTAFAIDVTVRTTLATTINGLQSDSARQYAICNGAASLGGPNGTTIVKTVDGVRAESRNPGDTVTYAIAFQNFGGSPATNVVLTDPFPAGVVPDAASVRVNGLTTGFSASANGQTLTVRIPVVPGGALTAVSASGTVVKTSAPGSSMVNVASVGADNLPPVGTTPASVLIGVSNVVYDGLIGESHPVQGATVTLVDAVSGLPLKLPAAGGIAPNTANVNPFVTGSDGVYSFDFDPLNLQTQALARRVQTLAQPLPSSVALLISAPNYRPRRIGVTFTPDATGMLYNISLSSSDGQQLAVPGGFGLVQDGKVDLSNVFDLLGNQPLFALQPITLAKTADRSTVSAGDRIAFAITVRNSSAAPLPSIALRDTLPPGLGYAAGTARIDDLPAEPHVDGRLLTWTLNATADAAQHRLTYAAVVLAGAPVNAVLRNIVTATAGVGGSGSISATAYADVRVIGGIFSPQSAVTGRVFVDVLRSGFFAPHDAGIPGVRVFMEDGSSVVTDLDGRYSFPGVRAGMHVLRLDAATLPGSVRAFRDGRAAHGLTRLVHGVLDSGMLQDVNFALEAF